MKLTHIRIKDFRSFSGEHDFPVSSGVNYFVGPNNCGKSNLIRALELALDPDTLYAPERDRPIRGAQVGAPPTTRITLTFQVGKTSPEMTLLKHARQYELGVRKARKAAISGNIHMYAVDREVRMVTTFSASGARKTSFQAKGFGAASLPVDSEEHKKLESQFRSVVRFGVVHSGQDIESLLKGKFRQILQLVIADHLRVELERAEIARTDYLGSLQNELLSPLEAKVSDRVAAMFPEIQVATLWPDVPTVAETISSVDVHLEDSVATTLIDKGTGVRGAVLISMLQYLADQSRRSLVLAVEEPEAFLHPAGQETMRDQLEALAHSKEVSLVVTTHSPYVISRDEAALITELRKGPDGITWAAGQAAGDEDRAELLGSLYRDAGLARLLERAIEIPAGTRGVVVTEGFTDGFFIRLVCEAIGKEDLLDGIHFIPAGKAKRVVVQSILTEAATEAPVIALLDYDDNGRAAADKLKSFDWEPQKRLLSLRAWPGACAQHDIEIEDLLPRASVQVIIDKLGEALALDKKENCSSGWHNRVSIAWKEAAIASLSIHLPKNDPGGILWLVEELNRRIDRIQLDRDSRAAHLVGTTS